MKLKEADDNVCHLCLEAPVDPKREDNLCDECGSIVDKYNTPETEDMIELDEDCGCD